MQLILASHGPLAEAFLQSAELITGMRPSSCHVLTMAMETSQEEVVQELDELFSRFAPDEDVLAMTDVFGGSITNILVEYSVEHPMRIVAGTSFPMVLEDLLSQPSKCTDGFVDGLVKVGKDGVVDVNRHAAELGGEGEI